MDSDSEIPFANTLTPVSQNSICSKGEQECPKIWGRLYSRRIYIQPEDLQGGSCTFGRSVNCNVVFSPRNLDKKVLEVISKVHFKMTYESGNVFLEDYSKNGTFVNNILVGKNRCLLQNDDEISIGLQRLCFYVFKKFDCEEEEDCYLPRELRKKYIISKLLGEGSYGEVKLAFLKSTGKQFAIKKINKAVSTLRNNGLHTSIQILNEVNILRDLSNPFIITMHDVIDSGMAVFIVLDYMDGGELTKYIVSTNPPLSEKRSKLLFYQMALGIQYLHSKGVTHRDLKPGNILLRTKEEETLVKVVDFGLSKIAGNDVFMATTCGTPLFAAPEVVDSTHITYTQQVDIWSLGVILFYMLSRDLPFEAPHCRDLFQIIVNGKYEMDKVKWRNVSDHAKSLVQKMLVKDPEERITINNVLKHPWLNDNTLNNTVSRLMKEEAYEITSAYFNTLHKQEFDETLLIG